MMITLDDDCSFGDYLSQCLNYGCYHWTVPIGMGLPCILAISRMVNYGLLQVRLISIYK